MENYVVLHSSHNPNDYHIQECFTCQADDREHAIEQCYDAEPDNYIHTVDIEIKAR